MIKIAFIDDGINPKFIPPGTPFANYTATETEVFKSPPVTGITHGSMCYQIFNNHVRVPYELISVKALDNNTGTGNHLALLTALEWCSKQKIDIINMSMGTRQYTDFAVIAAAVHKLHKTVIVAACSNENVLTFPACLPSVIGVRHAPLSQLENRFAYLQSPYDQIQVLTNVKDEPISIGNNIIEKMSGANSFATPIISAEICSYIAQGINCMQTIQKQLYANSIIDTTFATHAFYKNCFVGWEENAVPIVAVPISTTVDNNMQELLALFVREGYRAITLSTTRNTDVKQLTFGLEWHSADTVAISDMIELYYNFALPDIIFLQASTEEIAQLPSHIQPDMTLSIAEMQDSTLAVYDCICTTLAH